MKRFNPAFLSMGTTAMIMRDAPGEGGAGGAGGDEAAKAAAKVISDAKAVTDAAALKVADEATAAAKVIADAAAAAAEGGTDAEKALAKEKADLLAEVMDKKAKLKTATDEAKTARDQLARYGDATPEKVAELMKKETDAEKATLLASGEFDRVKDMMATEHAKEIETLKAENTALKESASGKDATIDKLTLGADFSNSTFIKGSLILSPAKVRQLYGDRFGLENGQVVAYDKPSGAKDRIVMVDGSGANLSFDVALQRIIDADPDKKTMMKAKMAPGGGSRTPAPGGKAKVKDDGVRGAGRIVASLNAAGEI